jgi:group I intron endonuclease
MQFLVPAQHAKDSGIYIIRNSVNAKVYVGSAKTLKRRFNAHSQELKRNEHHAPFLQRFVNKYGIDCLRFELLELCAVTELIKREQFHLDNSKAANYKFGFNCCPTAGSLLGVKHTAEAKANMSAAVRKRMADPEARNKLSAAMKGRFVSEETRQKMSAANLRRVRNPETNAKISAAKKASGLVISDEHKAKISSALKGRVFSDETRAKLSLAAKENRRLRKERAEQAKAQLPLFGKEVPRG